MNCRSQVYKSMFLGIFILYFINNLTAQLPAELQLPELVSINRMPMRSSAFAYESDAMAKQYDRTKSANFLSLNGTWKFNWVQDPDQRPKDFFKTDFDDSHWDNFRIPASWETSGYGMPIYVNQPYDFAGHNLRYSKMNPPYDIPPHNDPVGSYRRKMILPANFDGRQIFLHVGNAKSCLFVWVNGRFVGYSEDSKLAAEFDITDFVHAGENLFAFQVYRWSDGSYLECQDMYRFSGIERDVFLYSTNKLNIRDTKVDARLDDSYRDGLLNITAEIDNYKSEKGYHSVPDSFLVEARFEDATGKVVYSDKTPDFRKVLGKYHTNVTFQTSLPNVNAWSAETPYLYTLYLTLRDKNDKILEVVPQRIGFKKIEIQGSNFLVNGKRVWIKGVNRHEHHPRNGHTLSREDMRKDMEMMKKLNINAVRNSHYPPDPYWMELCDEYGLYVVDEANIESHGLGYDLSVTLANKPLWQEAHLQRVQRMYERDKNHASVVTWSLGNEAGDGCNFYAAYDWLKQQTTLPVQYERDIDYGNPNRTNYSEIFCPQYYGPEDMAKYAHSDARLPFIQSEYAHIMGNSLGNFQDYWDIIASNPKLQGGYIWEWIDQNIDTMKNGRHIKAYGGDFPLEGPVDENLSDNNFCVKGVVDAYRNPTPMAMEVQKVYQNIHTTWKGGQTIDIQNDFFFRSLENVRLHWDLLQDGKIIESGELKNIEVAPQQHKKYTIPMKKKMLKDKEYQLSISYLLKDQEPFLPAGYAIAREQFELQTLPAIPHVPVSQNSFQTFQTTKSYRITGKNFEIIFNTEKGILASYTKDGVEVLQSGPVPAFWRAPTDNDIGAGFNKSLRMWRDIYQATRPVIVEVRMINETTYEVAFTKKLLGGDAIHHQSFIIYGDGSILVSNSFNAVYGKYPLLLRAGNDLTLNQSFQNISWYGRGPGENYWDRKTNTFIGDYKSTVAEQYYPYARPQESGNHTETRWVTFSNTDGHSITFQRADSLLNFSAIPYSLDDLDPGPEKKQYHSGELIPQDKIFLHIDLRQTGLQGIDSWGSWPLEKYRIPYRDYSYSYWILVK